MWVEVIFGFLLLVSLLARELSGLPAAEYPINILGTALALIYLISNWWINKPKERTPRTAILTISYGLVSALLTLTLVFYGLRLTGSDQMAILSLSVLTLVVLADFMSSLKRKMTINKRTLLRFGFFAIPIIIYFSSSIRKAT